MKEESSKTVRSRSFRGAKIKKSFSDFLLGKRKVKFFLRILIKRIRNEIRNEINILDIQRLGGEEISIIISNDIRNFFPVSGGNSPFIPKF